MRRNSLSILISLLIVPTLAVANEEVETEVVPMIINGQKADVEDYPYFASLYYDREDEPGGYAFNRCGATILDSSHVLTAAHCVKDNSYNLFTTVAIQVQYEDDFRAVEAVRARNFYIHPDYIHSSQARYPNDIAIIELERPLSKVGSEDYVQLPSDKDKADYREQNGTPFVIIGHGDTIDTGTYQFDTSPYLEWAPVRYYENCGEPGAKEDGSTPSRAICVDAKVLDGRYYSGCQGDSGGPLLWQRSSKNDMVQVGITSYGGSICGNPKYDITGVYTEVATYTAWIDSVLSDEKQPTFVATAQARAEARNNNPFIEEAGAAGWWWMFALFGISVGRTAGRRSAS